MTISTVDGNSAGATAAVNQTATHGQRPASVAGSVASVGQGSAASQGGKLPPVRHAQKSAQPSGIKAQTAPLDLGPIDKACDKFIAASNDVAKAREALNAARSLKDSRPAAYQEAKNNFDVASDRRRATERDLLQAIDKLVEKLSRRSSLSEERDPLDQRTVEVRILSAYAGKGDRDGAIRGAINLNRQIRLPTELECISDWMNEKRTFNVSQEAERKVIFDDASNSVVMSRASDSSEAGELRRNQFARLSVLLKGVKDLVENFNNDLFAALVIRCAKDMHLSGKDDFAELQKIVKPYGNAELDGWIDAQL